MYRHCIRLFDELDPSARYFKHKCCLLSYIYCDCALELKGICNLTHPAALLVPI